MPYLIDGHNLIPKVDGLSISSIDDEIQLIKRLQVFHQQTGKKIEVYFDNAPPGYNRTQRFGAVSAHFVREGSTADAAIQHRLEGLGRAASTWTVVSSDRQIQAAARGVHARIVSSEKFASELTENKSERTMGIEENAEVNLSPAEVEDWLRLFNNKGEKGNRD